MNLSFGAYQKMASSVDGLNSILGSDSEELFSQVSAAPHYAIAWWVIAIIVVMIVGSFVAGLLLMKSIPTLSSDPATLEDFTFPTTDEDRRITGLYGTTLTRPNLLWTGDFGSQTRHKKESLLGHAYYLSQIWAIGQPMDDVMEMRIDETIVADFTNAIKDVTLTAANWTKSTKQLTQAASGVFSGYTTETIAGLKLSITGGVSVEFGFVTVVSKVDNDTVVLATDIYGSDLNNNDIEVTPNKYWVKTGNGSTGDRPTGDHSFVTFTDGTQTELPTYFATQQGDATFYNGVTLAMFSGDLDRSRGENHTGAFIGDDVRTVPVYSFLVRHRPRILQSGDPTNWSIVGDRDMNPADILYDLYVNVTGFPVSFMDVSAWETAQKVLYTEGLGLSVPMNNSKQLEGWQKEIMRHIDGHVYFDEDTGKMTIKLLGRVWDAVNTEVDRPDYVTADVPIITEAHYKDCKWDLGTWEQVYSELVVKWTSQKDYKLTAYHLVNPASRDVLERIEPQTLSFPYITTSACAALRIAMIKRRYFLPGEGVRFKISRKAIEEIDAVEQGAGRAAFNLYPGDVVRISNTVHGVTALMLRVLGNTDTDNRREEITIEATIDRILYTDDDIPDIPEPEIPGPVDLDDPVQYPFVLGATRMHADRPAWQRHYAMAGAPLSGGATKFRLYLPVIGWGSAEWQVVGDYDFSGVGTLDNAFPNTGDDMFVSVAGFQVTDLVGYTAVSNTDEAWQSLTQGGIFLLIDPTVVDEDTLIPAFEVVAVQTFTNTVGDTWVATNVIRQIVGTPLLSHAGSGAVRVYQLPANLDIVEMFNDMGFSSSAHSSKFSPVNSAAEGPVVFYNTNWASTRWDYPLEPSGVKVTRFATESDASDYVAGVDPAPVPQAGEWIAITWMYHVQNGGADNRPADTVEAIETSIGSLEFVIEKTAGSGSVGYGFGSRPFNDFSKKLSEITVQLGRSIVFDTGSAGPITVSVAQVDNSHISGAVESASG